ncbi:MAG: TRAP transporter small permease [bacterium]
MKAIRRVDDAVEQVEIALLTAAFAVMASVMFTQVVLRYFFFRSIFWAEELAMYLMIWIICIGASVATKRRRHLMIDALVQTVPPGGKRYLALASSAVSAAACFLMAKVGADYVSAARAFGQVSVAMHLPMWILYLSLPVATVMMGLRFTALAVEEAAKLFRRGTEGG